MSGTNNPNPAAAPPPASAASVSASGAGTSGSSASTSSGIILPTSSAPLTVQYARNYAPSIRVSDIPKLVGSSNYTTWSLMIMRYLEAVGLWAVVNGTWLQPADTGFGNQQEWNAADNSVNFILLQTTDPSLHHLLADSADSSAKHWRTLKANYGSESTLASFIKFKQYFSAVHDESKPLSEHLEKHGQLWKDIQDSGILANPELLHIFGLFTSLPESFNNVIEPILAVTKPADLKFDDLRSRLIVEEIRRTSGNTNVSAIRNGNSSSSSSKPSGNGKGNKKKKKGKCNFCGYLGHHEAECNKKKKAAEEAQKHTGNGNGQGQGGGKGSGNSSSNTGSASVHVVTAEESTSEAASVAASFYAQGSAPWMLDSGCTRHMTNNLNDFTEYTPFKSPSIATLADNAKTTMATLGSGKVYGTTIIDGKRLKLELNGVLYCPTIAHRTISISCLNNKGFSTVFGNGQSRIVRDSNTYGIGTLRNGQYWLGLAISAPTVTAASMHTSVELAH